MSLHDAIECARVYREAFNELRQIYESSACPGRQDGASVLQGAISETLHQELREVKKELDEVKSQSSLKDLELMHMKTSVDSKEDVITHLQNIIMTHDEVVTILKSISAEGVKEIQLELIQTRESIATHQANNEALCRTSNERMAHLTHLEQLLLDRDEALEKVTSELTNLRKDIEVSSTLQKREHDVEIQQICESLETTNTAFENLRMDHSDLLNWNQTLNTENHSLSEQTKELSDVRSENTELNRELEATKELLHSHEEGSRISKVHIEALEAQCKHLSLGIDKFRVKYNKLKNKQKLMTEKFKTKLINLLRNKPLSHLPKDILNL